MAERKLDFPPSPVTLPALHRRDVWLATRAVRNVPVPPVPLPKDPERKRRALADFAYGARVYFPRVYFDPERYHENVLRDFQAKVEVQAAGVVFKNAEAGPRSIGKSTTRLIGCLLAALKHVVRMTLWIGYKDENARKRLRWVKNQLLFNDLLHEDFPEITQWVRQFGGDPRRCPANYSWSDDFIKLISGEVFVAAGISSGLEGMLEDYRPDCTIFDDVETAQSVRSKAETEAIAAGVAAGLKLHDINFRAAYFYLGNVRTPDCVTARFTDPKKEPGWNGRRYRGLDKFPDREDLWLQFVEICRNEAEPPGDAWLLWFLDPVPDLAAALGMSDEGLREKAKENYGYILALWFYVERRAEMDAGAALMDARRLPLHECYRTIAEEGEKTFLCEIQNDPPPADDRLQRDLDVEFLQTRCVGEARGVVPDWAAWVFATVDMGLHRCHWEMDAWAPDLTTAQLVLEGWQETFVNEGGQYAMAEKTERKWLLMEDGIRFALVELAKRFAQGLRRRDDSLVPVSLVAVDARGLADGKSWQHIVFEHCFRSGPQWFPTRGDSFKPADMQRAQGRSWICERLNNPMRCIEFDADTYKTNFWRALTAPPFDENGRPNRGARFFHRQTPREYLRHYAAERYVEDFKEGRPVDKQVSGHWEMKGSKRAPNHWWDTGTLQQLLAELAPWVGLGRQTAQRKPAPAQSAPPIFGGTEGGDGPSWAVKRERF